LGFFAGDGYYSLKKGKYPHYGITLYDEKIKLLDSLEYSHSCGPYPPSGKVMVTLDKDKFWDKLFIPFQYDLPSKIAWLEGICDADGGCQAKKGESTWSSIGITSINEQFLRDIQLLLCTMGCQSSVSLMKEECVKPMPDGRGGEKEYACATSYRLLIPAHSVSILSLECGFSPKRLKVKQGWVKARCSKIVRVKSVERTGEIAEKVYCFTDPKRGMGMFNGIATLNCGEQMLPNWANCLLGCMVLTKYSTPDGTFDYTRFLTDVKTAVYILNVFSEMNRERHPLQPQREMDEFSRRIGIEMTGIGDVLAALGMTYGSTEAVQFLSDLAKRKAIAELEASVEAVAKFGVAPALEPREARERFVECNYYTNLVDGYECRDILTNAILDTGLANTAFNTMGPCGSISIISGNLTSGGEPLYKFAYARKNKIDGKTYEMIHRPAVVRMLEDFNRFKGKTLEEAKVMLGYVEANEVDPMDRLRMQSALQEYTDASISSTLNLPENTTPQEISKIYLEAYELGLKGVTVFRENCKVGVLGAISEKQKTSALPLPAPGTLIKRGLFDVEEATRYRVFWKKAKLYVIVSTDGDEMPIEVFAKLPVEAGANGDGQFNPTLWQERTSNWDLACRLISMLLRYGIPLEEVLEQLQKSAYTMVDVASVLKRVLAKYRPSALPDELDEGDGSEGVRGAKCPECKQMALFHEGGCAMCRECGFTTCG
jgi:ribonucleoside-diphosphate reductase alpha chain